MRNGHSAVAWMIGVLLLEPAMSFGAPAVVSVGGPATDGTSIVISGRGFGQKSPAKPYLWAPMDGSIAPSPLGVVTSWNSTGQMSYAASCGTGGGGCMQGATSNGVGTNDWAASVLSPESADWNAYGQESYIYRKSKRTFDYDSSNGIGAGQRDFESAALHEIGHALGFISEVETLSSSVSPTPLDMFRFQNGAANVDPTTATFGTTPRALVTGGVPIFDDGGNEWAMSSQTDGYGASHWKDDSLTGIYIGLMDPAGVNGQAKFITNADLRAFDLIGYELTTVPEPASLSALTFGAAGLRRRRPWRSL